jgi:flagellar hook-associated protein 2
MSSVGSTLKAEGVDQQLLVTAPAHAVHQPVAAPDALPSDEAHISSTGRLRGASMAVRDVVQSLAQNPIWHAQQVQSSAPQQVQASSESASTGDNAVAVQALASAQVTSTPSYTSLSTVVGIGTLHIEMGKWGGSSSTFATNPNWPKASVTLDSRDNTLERVRDRINAAGVGVIAAVVSDATGSRLVLSATSTGADNGFRIQAEPGDVDPQALQGNQIDQFAFDPSKAGGTQGMQLVQPARDAQLTLNDRALSSESNVLDDSATGLRLSLQSTTQAPVQLNVRDDNEGIQRRLQSLAASSQDLLHQVQQRRPEGQAGAHDAHQEALQVLDTLKAALTGPDADAWQAIGLSWNDQSGIRQQDVNWTSALKQQGQALFAALNQQWPSPGERPQDAQTSVPVSPDVVAPDSANMPSANTAAVHRIRQRLLDQYAAAAPAPDESTRQDLAIS